MRLSEQNRKTETVLTVLLLLVLLAYLALYAYADFRGFARLALADMYEDTLVARLMWEAGIPVPEALPLRQPVLCDRDAGAGRPVLRALRQHEHRHGPGHHGHEPADSSQHGLDAAPGAEKALAAAGRAAGLCGSSLRPRQRPAGRRDPALLRDVQLLRLLRHHQLRGSGRLCPRPALRRLGGCPRCCGWPRCASAPACRARGRPPSPCCPCCVWRGCACSLGSGKSPLFPPARACRCCARGSIRLANLLGLVRHPLLPACKHTIYTGASLFSGASAARRSCAETGWALDRQRS